MGEYFFAKDGNKVIFKLTGTLKYTTSGHFDSFLDSFFASAGDIEKIVIDLTEADFLDSTNLGFLAKIAEFMLDRNGSKTTIHSISDDVNRTLESVGFDEIFNLEKTRPEPDGESCIIDPSGFEKKDRTLMMLDAHKCLMKINDKNEKTFGDVVSLMEQSLKCQNPAQ